MKMKKKYSFLNNLSDKSSISNSNEIGDYYIDDVELKSLYNFGNFSFEKEMRTFIRHFIKDKKKYMNYLEYIFY